MNKIIIISIALACLAIVFLTFVFRAEDPKEKRGYLIGLVSSLIVMLVTILMNAAMTGSFHDTDVPFFKKSADAEGETAEDTSTDNDDNVQQAVTDSNTVDADIIATLSEDQTVVPFLINHEKREAHQLLACRGLEYEETGDSTLVDGDSYVISQSPAGGVIVDRGSVVRVEITFKEPETVERVKSLEEYIICTEPVEAEEAGRFYYFQVSATDECILYDQGLEINLSSGESQTVDYLPDGLLCTEIDLRGSGFDASGYMISISCHGYSGGVIMKPVDNKVSIIANKGVYDIIAAKTESSDEKWQGRLFLMNDEKHSHVIEMAKADS